MKGHVAYKKYGKVDGPVFWHFAYNTTIVSDHIIILFL